MPRHFLTGEELDREQLLAVLARAHQLKAAPASSDALAGKSVALIFEKPSTRTRLSYEVGVTELGGHAVVLRPGEMQLSRGESIADTARVLSGQVAAVGVRTGPDALIEELAAEGSIPVFNMLTELHHPSQALADLMTLQEAFPDRPLDEIKLAYVGDGNNVARSLALLGTTAGLEVVVASPQGYELEPDCGGERSNDQRDRQWHVQLGEDGRRGADLERGEHLQRHDCGGRGDADLEWRERVGQQHGGDGERRGQLEACD